MNPAVLVILALGIGVLIVAVLRAKREGTSPKSRSLLDYMLLWPLLLDLERERDPAREAQLFTKREWIGWGLLLVLMLVAVITTW